MNPDVGDRNFPSFFFAFFFFVLNCIWISLCLVHVFHVVHRTCFIAYSISVVYASHLVFFKILKSSSFSYASSVLSSVKNGISEPFRVSRAFPVLTISTYMMYAVIWRFCWFKHTWSWLNCYHNKRRSHISDSFVGLALVRCSHMRTIWAAVVFLASHGGCGYSI